MRSVFSRGVWLAGLLAGWLLLGSPAAWADAPPKAEAKTTAVAGKEKGPVPVPPPSEDALAYYETGNLAWMADTIWTMAIPLILIFSGWGAAVGRVARRLSAHWMGEAAWFWLLCGLIYFAADFPVMFLRSWMRPRWFGLSEQSLKDWALQTVQWCGVELALGLVIAVGGLSLIRRWPKRWWLAAGLLALPLLLALVFFEPVVVEPLFNRFVPLQDKGLESKVLALAESAGLAHPAVFQVNKSRQTKALNAYVSGLAGSARIVLWDTLFPKMSEREILSIVAHEIGHRALHHVVKGTILGWLLLVAALWGCRLAAPGLLRRWGSRLGAASLGEPPALLLLAFLLLVAQFVLSPAAFAYSRHIEAQADRFAVELTRDGHAGASAQLKLSLQNLSNPRPGWIYTFFRATHPSDASRIEFFNSYKPSGSH